VRPCIIFSLVLLYQSDADKNGICPQRWEPRTADRPALQRERSFRGGVTVTKKVESEAEKGVCMICFLTRALSRSLFVVVACWTCCSGRNWVFVSLSESLVVKLVQLRTHSFGNFSRFARIILGLNEFLGQWASVLR